MSESGAITVRFADGPLAHHTEVLEVDPSALPEIITRHTHAGLVRYEIAPRADSQGAHPARLVQGDGVDTGSA